MAQESIDALEKSGGFHSLNASLLTDGVPCSTRIFVAADVRAAVEGLFGLA
jgi:hypothetical protein